MNTAATGKCPLHMAVILDKAKVQPHGGQTRLILMFCINMTKNRSDGSRFRLCQSF